MPSSHSMIQFPIAHPEMTNVIEVKVIDKNNRFCARIFVWERIVSIVSQKDRKQFYSTLKKEEAYFTIMERKMEQKQKREKRNAC